MKSSHLFKVFLSAVALMLVARLDVFGEQTEGPRATLLGRIVESGGAALPGAKVFIYSAGPRVGISPFCPTCYADCRKSGNTDRNGNFVIDG